jgi:biopolymer transport protein ExbD
MAINLPASGASGDPDVLVDINTTPLIDVLLVLLIMLIITIPVKLHSVSLDLPADAPPPLVEPPEPVVVRIDIDAGGTIHWNGEAVLPGPTLDARLRAAATLPVQPELHLYPDQRAAYKVVAKVLAAAQRNGITRIGIAEQQPQPQPAAVD